MIKCLLSYPEVSTDSLRRSPPFWDILKQRDYVNGRMYTRIEELVKVTLNGTELRGQAVVVAGAPRPEGC